MWAATVLELLGALCDNVVRLDIDLNLHRLTPGITGLLLNEPSHSACTRAYLVSFVTGERSATTGELGGQELAD